MSYKTTRRCDDDLIEIYMHGAASFGVEQAEHYYAGLVASFVLLAENPHIARKRAEFTPPVRLHPYHSHMIVFVERDDNILVIRVLHGRQDWKQHLLAGSGSKGSIQR